MSKLKMINNYYINTDNIAYMEHCLMEDGQGTRIVFNAYAAAGTMDNWGWEALSIEIFEKTPTEIADFLNDEPAF